MKKIIKHKVIPYTVGKYLNTFFRFSEEKAVNKAFSIFCTPRKGRTKPHQSEFLQTAEPGELIFQNEKIRFYQWKGTGKTILLVHGWESNSYRWRKLIPELKKKDYNIISVDAPAHGGSSGNQINLIFYAEVIQELMKVHKPSYLVGHSIGGLTVIFNHFTYRNRFVEKIVSLGAPSEMEAMMKNYQSLLRLKDPVMQKLESYFKNNFGFSFQEFSAERFTEEFQIPGLLIHDKKDKIVPLHASEAINNSWKKSELMVTEGLGHSLQAKEVNNKIIQFFQN